MNNSERYWINAAIYMLLGAMFGDNDKSIINSVAVIVCYALSASYFVAMVVSSFRSEQK